MINTSNNMLYHIGNLNTQSQRVSYQMATGEVIDKGSDNSLLHADLINLDDKLRVTEGLKLQIDKTRALNDTADTNIGDVKLALDSIKIDLMKGLNDGLDRSDKSALATNMSSTRESIIDRVNTSLDGEYLFSGSDTTVKTLEMDSDFDLNGKVSFEGNGFLREIAIEPGVYRERGVTAYDVSFYAADSATAGRDLTFGENERIIDENGNEWKLNANGNRLQKYDYNDVLIEPKDEIKVSIPPSDKIKIDLGINDSLGAMGDYTVKITGDDGVEYAYTYTATGTDTANDIINTATDGLKDQIEATVDGNGDPLFSVSVNGGTFTIASTTLDGKISVKISDTDNNTDHNITASNQTEATATATSVQNSYVLTVPGSSPGQILEAKHNYFDDLNVIINALEGFTTKLDGTKGDIATDDLVEDILRDGLGQSTEQFDATNVGHGELGGRNNIFEISYAKILTQETHYNILIQEWGGADLAKLAMESQALDMTYQALYSTISKMNQLSLVNFIK